MKTTWFLKIAAMSLILSNPILSYAESKTTYDCIGMDSKGKKIHSSLTMSPTKKGNIYNTVWTYAHPKSRTDAGIAHVLDKNRMLEEYQSKTSLDKGKSDLYQISDNELLIHHIHFDKHHKIQFTRTGYCKKTST